MLNGHHRLFLIHTPFGNHFFFLRFADTWYKGWSTVATSLNGLGVLYYRMNRFDEVCFSFVFFSFVFLFQKIGSTGCLREKY